MNRRTQPQTPALAVLLLLGLSGCGGADPNSNAEIEPDADLTDLLALPYLSWSDEEADPSQLGVTVNDSERAWQGVNLYTNDVNEAYLLDMSGRRLHTWKLPEQYDHCEHFEVLPRGQLVGVCAPQALVKLDWESNVLWINDISAHHDIALLEDGSMLVPFGEALREFNGRQVGFDGIALTRRSNWTARFQPTQSPRSPTTTSISIPSRCCPIHLSADQTNGSEPATYCSACATSTPSSSSIRILGRSSGPGATAS
jgi:hypothetical protein